MNLFFLILQFICRKKRKKEERRTTCVCVCPSFVHTAPLLFHICLPTKGSGICTFPRYRIGIIPSTSLTICIDWNESWQIASIYIYIHRDVTHIHKYTYTHTHVVITFTRGTSISSCLTSCEIEHTGYRINPKIKRKGKKTNGRRSSQRSRGAFCMVHDGYLLVQNNR